MAPRQLIDWPAETTDPLGNPEHDAEHDERGADDPQVPELLVDGTFEANSQQDDRQRTDDDEPTHAPFGRRAVLLAAQCLDPARADGPDVPPKVNEHRKFGADLHNRSKCGPGVLPSEELREDCQMRT